MDQEKEKPGDEKEGACTCPIFDVWMEYEKVAMHFNELIMKLRTQSLAGVAVFAAIAAAITRGDITVEMRWGIMTGAFALLTVFWVAIWLLDFLYYKRLLLGAVRALLVIEKRSKDSAFADKLTLSTDIEAAFETAKAQPTLRGDVGPRMFYLLVFGALVIGLAISAGHLESWW